MNKYPGDDLDLTDPIADLMEAHGFDEVTALAEYARMREATREDACHEGCDACRWLDELADLDGFEPDTEGFSVGVARDVKRGWV